jgi:branched-chain amino acid transport system substrate-binding protein
MMMRTSIIAALLLAAAPLAEAHAQGDPARIAVILPLSGAYARSGELELAGIKMAVEEVNASGGIRALGGKKIAIEVKDAGTSVETAVSAARQLLGGGEKISGGIGAWLSSYTLGVSEMAERRRIPWLSVSSSDQVSNRGFQYLYQSVAPSSAWAQAGLEYLKTVSEQRGCPIKTVAIVGDNTAAPTAFFNAVRSDVAKKLGWTIAVDTTWTPPLADATSIAQQLQSAKPDLVLFGASNFSDAAQVLSKGIEFKVKTNYVGNGSWLVMPEYLQSVGAKNLEGIFDISGMHPLKGFDSIEDRFKQATKEPFLQQEGLAGYAHIWIFKEAMEKAGSDDPEAINKAIKALDLTTGPAAAALPSGRVKFDDKGRLAGATPVIAQWQNGLPVSVYPVARAAGQSKFECAR